MFCSPGGSTGGMFGSTISASFFAGWEKLYSPRVIRRGIEVGPFFSLEMALTDSRKGIYNSKKPY